MSRRKIKVFVDAEVLVIPHFSGIGHYTLELLRALDDILDSRSDIKVTLGVYFRRINKIRSYGFRNFNIRRTPFPLRISNGLKTRGRQPYYDLLFGKCVYLFPNYTSWPLLFSKSIPVVYDLSFEHYPQYVEPRNQKFLHNNVLRAVNWATKIITISENSKKEIAEFYHLPQHKVSIVHPGVDQSAFFRWPDREIAKVKARYGIHGKYLLFVGNIEPRKNLKNLLLAYERLDHKTREEYSLLLIGARGWLDDEIFSIIERLRIAGNFIQQPVGYVEDEDRPALYSGASAFVYPSLYEGFGIPPLEAMACGVPTITSNNSSLPEAVGDAALTVDADSVDELTSAINLVLSDATLRKMMVKKGFAQVDKYIWQNKARELVKVIEEAAHA